MTSKVRLLTRSFDLSIEGESVEEVEELMNAIETRGYIRGRATLPPTTDALREPILESAIYASKEVDDTRGLEELPSSAIGGFIAQGGVAEGGTPVAAGMSTSISRVVKRDKEIYMLSPKFPSGPSGDRSGDAALILLAAYDQNNETPVTGSRLLKSLKNTGYSLERVDKILEPLGGLVLTEGIRRGRRYGLSEAGRAQAQKLAEELLALKGQPMQPGMSQ